MLRHLLITLALMIFIGASALAKAPQRDNDTAVDLIVIYKKQRWLALYNKTHLLTYYDIALGPSPVGDKQFEGDGRTPEGKYKIVEKRIHPVFYKSLKISYPNKDDIAFAKSQGRSPGGQILIHGIKKPFGFVGTLHDLVDWTQGCVAVTNEEMDEIFDLVQVGTKVIIRAE
jgi:murein L,D-transpeptidase YafK